LAAPQSRSEASQQQAASSKQQVERRPLSSDRRFLLRVLFRFDARRHRAACADHESHDFFRLLIEGLARQCPLAL